MGALRETLDQITGIPTSDLDERQLLHAYRASHVAVNAYSWLCTACTLIALYFKELGLAATIFGSLLFITIARRIALRRTGDDNEIMDIQLRNNRGWRYWIVYGVFVIALGFALAMYDGKFQISEIVFPIYLGVQMAMLPWVMRKLNAWSDKRAERRRTKYGPFG